MAHHLFNGDFGILNYALSFLGIDGPYWVSTSGIVTVPLLTPSIFFVTIITVISNFQLFDLLYAILGSQNPVLPKSLSLVYLFYQAGFVTNEKGYAAAIAMVIFVLIGVVTLIQFRLQKRWVQVD